MSYEHLAGLDFCIQRSPMTLMEREAIEGKVLELEKAIARNRAEYEKLQAELNACRNHLSPSSRLSDDLLTLVFDACNQDDDSSITDRKSPLW
ncbi:hypothetical protein V5O48_019733, partial [Marasmius crinis-equi]